MGLIGGGMPQFDIPGMPGAQIGMINLSDIMGKAFGQQQKKRRKMRVAEAWDKLVEEEQDKRLEKRYEKLRHELIELTKQVRLNNARIEQLVEQLYEFNRRLVASEGKLMRLADSCGVKRDEFLSKYQGKEVDRQDHLGYDLATTSNAPVTAANDGVVVYANATMNGNSASRSATSGAFHDEIAGLVR